MAKQSKRDGTGDKKTKGAIGKKTKDKKASKKCFCDWGGCYIVVNMDA